MDVLTVEKLNEVYLRITGEPHIEQELSEYFKFDVPQAKFMPAFRKRQWSGSIYLYSLRTKTIYCGLLKHLEQFCKERDIKINYLTEFNYQDFTLEDAEKFINLISPSRVPRDYQLDAFVNCVKEHRSLTLSPTGSGKSLIIYLLTRLYTFNPSSRKALIIVPTINLVHQMANDFVSYGYDNEKIYRITAGVEKHSSVPVFITTWQSIYKMPRQWFEQFKIVIGDECHQYKSKSLTSILTKLTHCKYRFGFTGTLDGMQVNKLVIEGLFGPTKRVITTKELIDRKQLADLNIKILVLKYTEEMCKLAKDFTYPDEMDFICGDVNRNEFIKKLASDIKGNTLILFQYVEKHGKILYDQLSQTDKICHFIHGGIKGEDREEIRSIVENSNNDIIIASYGTFSTGVNIVNLNNVIFASPSKSKIRNLQSIGRGLRTSDTKKTATLYDIADDLTYKNKRNYTLNHLLERVKIYDSERLPYETHNIKLYRDPSNYKID